MVSIVNWTIPLGTSSSKQHYNHRNVLCEASTQTELIGIANQSKCRQSEQSYSCFWFSCCRFRPNSRATLSAVRSSWTTPSLTTRSTAPPPATCLLALFVVYRRTGASRVTTPCLDHSEACVNWTARAGTPQLLSSTDQASCLFKLFSSRWVLIEFSSSIKEALAHLGRDRHARKLIILPFS